MARQDEFASPDRHAYDLPLSSSGRAEVPLGFKQQVAAAKIQSYLRGARDRILLSKIAARSKHKCPICTCKYASQKALKMHIDFYHESQF